MIFAGGLISTSSCIFERQSSNRAIEGNVQEGFDSAASCHECLVTLMIFH